jgi:hypothetical protein
LKRKRALRADAGGKLRRGGIIATAKAKGLTLITVDENIHKYDVDLVKSASFKRLVAWQIAYRKKRKKLPEKKIIFIGFRIAIFNWL